MGHIVTRDERLQDYDQHYPERTDDAEERVRAYFSAHNLDLSKACEKASKKLKKILDKRRYETIRIVLYEYPMQTDRPRTFGHHTFSPNAAANKDYLRRALSKIMDTVRLINTPAEIRVDAYLEMPKAVPPDEVILFEARALMPVDKPDYDNIGKCYTDMLTGIITSDDDLFYHGEVNKYYSLLPRVEILITYIVAHESDYIYKKLRARKSIKAGIESGRIVLQKLGDDEQ